MSLLETALSMIEKYPLCDHCLGRQFAQLGRGIENIQRGAAIKLTLTMRASVLTLAKNPKGSRQLRALASNGFSHNAEETLRQYGKHAPKEKPEACFLCDGKFQQLDTLLQKTLLALGYYEYTSFLIGVELPVQVEEREDEFKAAFNTGYSESIKHEFGRLIGKQLEALTGKAVEYMKPDIAVVVNPWKEKVTLQVNPLFVAGRYRKLVRTLPQSKWFCSNCRGRGCEKCGGTGKMYPESVEEIVSKPFLDATEGEKTSFHASGREDIDAKMLGTGRPFVVEVSKPKKRFLDLTALKEAVNMAGKRKVQISALRFTNRGVVRRLKKAESAQKEYRAIVEFDRDVSDDELRAVADKLTGISIKQQTPMRVLHRRADLIREKYIYWVKVKKVARNQAELKVRCQGGLYVKELVSGDAGRTKPSVSELLNTGAKTLKLDVLKVIVDLEKVKKT
jgi:tRNA pseudouridine synthase 10